MNIAGAKIARIDDHILGKINDHTTLGIYGTIENHSITGQTMESASSDEIQLGDAYFLTELSDNTVKKVSIQITDLKTQTQMSSKGITFTVIDQSVLDETNGIIQGMSGSPIIQNNKVVGCVTHVSSQNPAVGYGLYIDWMLETDRRVE